MRSDGFRFARVMAIAVRIWQQFRRDKRSLALLFVVPVVVMLLLGYIIDQGDTPAKVAVVVEDAGFRMPFGGVAINVGVELEKTLAADKALSVERLEKSAWEKKLRARELDGVIVIPPGFTAALLAGKRPELKLHLEGSNPATSAKVQRAVSQALMQRAESGVAGAGGNGLVKGGPPVKLNVDFLYGGTDFGLLDYYGPGFIAGFSFFFVFLLTSVSFLRERATGTMERLAAAPVRRSEVVLGYMIGFSAFAIIQVAILLFFLIYVLEARVAGSLWTVLLIELLLTLGAVNLGIFLSFFARNELQVAQFIPLVIVPQILLGGIMWPVESLGPGLKWLAWLMPLFYADEALKDVMIRGASIVAVWPRALVLAAFAVVMVALSARNLKGSHSR